ncbi:MAG TPA: T9SS type A sorting domain-containing protein [Bacteroidales bacterium]|nr:T9SS type A sorting domain-containing protein [Bacteroidales bacterium]
MKAKVLLISAVLILASLISISQPAIQWQRSLGGSGIDDGNAIVQTSDGGYLVVGTSDWNDGDVHGNHGQTDFWVVRLSALGDTLWERSYGGSLFEEAYSVGETNDHGFILAGFSSSSDGDVTVNHGQFDYWIVKLDSAGILQWQRSFGGSGDDIAYCVKQTFDGGYIVSGSSVSNDGDVTGNHGDDDYWIVKLNGSGDLIWQKSLGGSSYDIPGIISQTKDSGFIVNGFTFSNDGQVTGNHGNEDYWVVRLDKTGNLLWAECLGGGGEDYGFTALELEDGGFIAGGYAASSDGQVSGNHGLDDYWLVRLNDTGGIVWSTCLGGSDVENGCDVKITPTGEFIVAGISYSSDQQVTHSHGEGDYWIVRVGTTGNLIWEKALGGSSEDEAHSLALTGDGGAIVAGYSLSNDGDVTGNHGDHDFWVVKLSSFTGIADAGHNDLLPVYPNPAKDQIAIGASKTVSGIRLTDMNGLDIPVQARSQGDQTIINTSALPAGVYLLSFNLDGTPVTRKIVIER